MRPKKLNNLLEKLVQEEEKRLHDLPDIAMVNIVGYESNTPFLALLKRFEPRAWHNYELVTGSRFIPKIRGG